MIVGQWRIEVRQFIAVALSILLAAPVFTQAQNKNSFQEVTSHLDPGGNLYLYLSTEEWLNGLSSQVSQFRALVDTIPGTSPADKQSASRFFDLLTNLVKHSGVEDISGFGISGIAVEKDLFRSRSLLHHYPGKDTGYL